MEPVVAQWENAIQELAHPLNHVKTQLATHAKMVVRASQSFQEVSCAHAQTGTKVQTAPSRCAVKTSALSASSA